MDSSKKEKRRREATNQCSLRDGKTINEKYEIINYYKTMLANKEKKCKIKNKRIF